MAQTRHTEGSSITGSKVPPAWRTPDLRAIAARFRILAVPVRLAILHALHDGELSVTQLTERVKTSQPNVSKHLKVLVEAGMVQRREQGATTYCSILDRSVYRLCDLVCSDAPSRRRPKLQRT